MSYDQIGGFENFFVPNIPLATTTAGVKKEIDIGDSSADHGEYLCVHPCVVYQLQFTMTGEVAGGTSAAPTVLFKKRPTPLSATDESTMGVLTIPDATAVGKTVYKKITPVAFKTGDSIEISHTVGTGTPTGQGHASILAYATFEEPTENTDMIESA
jgi:hypothetical protein